MSEMTFRTLRADEIDVRIGQQKPSGVSLLLYKDARCDMAILDETVGPLNWMRSHCRDNANCVVSIYDEEKSMWISKEDTGTESNTEAEKGLASDSFKRACVNWGIGRELYSAPFIWVKAEKLTFKEVNGKKYMQDRLSVKEIEYDECRRISRLTIESDKSGIVYDYPSRSENEKSETGASNVKVLQPIQGSVPPKKGGVKRRAAINDAIQELRLNGLEDFQKKVEELKSIGIIRNVPLNDMDDDEFTDAIADIIAHYSEAAS